MPASRIFRFARTSRCASVASGTRKARATSSVCRPPTSRSVSATCDSTASAGWQHVKTRLRRSSGIELKSSSSSVRSSSSRVRSSVLRARVRSRRIRSIARLRAVVTIHAPGLRGTPSRGQRSSAVVNASCTASSASSKSPRTRMRIATACPHSSRKRASTASASRAAVSPPSLCRRAGRAVQARSPGRGPCSPRGNSRRASPSSPRTARR
jgi:hypothetical protein